MPRQCTTHLTLPSHRSHSVPSSPSSASIRPLTVILAEDEQQKDAYTDLERGLGAAEQPQTGSAARSLAARCPSACLLLNHQRTRPVFLFTAIFISSNEARSSSGTSEGKGGMASGEEGPDPGDVPQPAHAPGSSCPIAASRQCWGPHNVCFGISFLYPSPTWGWKMRTSHPARSRHILPQQPWSPAKGHVPSAPTPAPAKRWGAGGC